MIIIKTLFDWIVKDLKRNETGKFAIHPKHWVVVRTCAQDLLLGELAEE